MLVGNTQQGCDVVGRTSYTVTKLWRATSHDNLEDAKLSQVLIDLPAVVSVCQAPNVKPTKNLREEI